MKVECEITIDDHLKFNEHLCANSPTIRQNKLVAYWLGPVAFVLVGSALSLRDGSASGIVIFGIVSLFWLIYYPKYWDSTIRKRTLKLLREGPVGVQPYQQAIRIDADGVHAETPKGSAITKWSAIEKVEEGAAATYLYIGPFNAYVLPRRAFKDSEEHSRFLSTVRHFREAEAGLIFDTDKVCLDD